MPVVQLLIAGLIAGILANGSGYLITGRLFHPYQARTPNTWRASESWQHYQYATLVRLAACIGIGFFYAAAGAAFGAPGAHWLWRGACFGACLWAVTVLPLVLEVALFVNWHRGFIAGLILDWLVVCILASAAAALVTAAP